MALQVKLTGTPYRYLKSLDKPTRDRVTAKLKEIAADPLNSRFSKPLSSSSKRSSRVGSYRILFEIRGEVLEVSDIGPRGQIYRKA